MQVTGCGSFMVLNRRSETLIVNRTFYLFNGRNKNKMRNPTSVVVENKTLDFSFDLILSVEGSSINNHRAVVVGSDDDPNTSGLFMNKTIEAVYDNSSEKSRFLPLSPGDRKSLFVINPKSQEFKHGLFHDDQSLYATVHLFPMGQASLDNNHHHPRMRLQTLQKNAESWLQIKLCLSGKLGSRHNPKLLYSVSAEPSSCIQPEHEWKSVRAADSGKGGNGFFMAKFRNAGSSFLINYRLKQQQQQEESSEKRDVLEFILYHQERRLGGSDGNSTSSLSLNLSPLSTRPTTLTTQRIISGKMISPSSSSLSASSAASAPQPTNYIVFDEVYENQRGSCLLGGKPRFSSNSLFPTDRTKWSSRDGKFLPDIKYYELPNPNWTWVTPWRIDLGDNKNASVSNDDGWMYALNWNTGWSTTPSLTSCVRRRRWIRGRQKIRDGGSTAATSSVGDSSSLYGSSRNIVDRLRAGRVDREKKMILSDYLADPENRRLIQRVERKLLHILSYFEYESAKVQVCQMVFPFVKNDMYKYQAIKHLTFYSDKEALAKSFSLSLSSMKEMIADGFEEEAGGLNDEDDDLNEEDSPII